MKLLCPKCEKGTLSLANKQNDNNIKLVCSEKDCDYIEKKKIIKK